MMVIRELVTKLSYEVDKKNLSEYKRGASKVAGSLPQMMKSGLGSTLEQIKTMGAQAKASVKLQAQRTRELAKLEKIKISAERAELSQLEREKRNNHREELARIKSEARALKQKAMAERQAIRDRKSAENARNNSLATKASTSHHIGTSVMGVGAVATAGTSLLFNEGFQSLRDMQTTIAKYSAMLKSKTEGANLYNKVQNFSNNVPLSNEYIDRVASSLLASNKVSTDELVPLLTKLGDITQGNSDLFERVGRQYNQVLTMGSPTMEELRTIGEAGVGIIDAIQKNLGINEEQFRKMSNNRQITSKIFIDAIDRIAEERKGTMAEINKTLGGQKDLLDKEFLLMLREFVQSVEVPVTQLIKILRGAVAVIRSIPSPIKSIILITTGFATTLTFMAGLALTTLATLINIYRLMLTDSGRKVVGNIRGMFGGKGVASKSSSSSRKFKQKDKSGKKIRNIQTNKNKDKPDVLDIFVTLMILKEAVMTLWYVITKTASMFGKLVSKLTSFVKYITPLASKFLGLIGAFSLLHDFIFKLVPFLEKGRAGDANRGIIYENTAKQVDQFYYKNAKRNDLTGVTSPNKLDINVVAKLDMPEGSTQQQKAYLKKVASDVFRSELTSKFLALQSDTTGVQ